MASAVRRKRLRDAGYCSQCKNPPVTGKTRCQKHLDQANELARRRNKERKMYGLCIRCPNKAQQGHVLCEECMSALRRREIDWDGKRSKDKTKQQQRQAAGLCKWCENPRSQGRALCEEHLKAEREKISTYRAERKAKGLCWRCDNPVRQGGGLCQAHRDEVTRKERREKSESRAGNSVAGQVPAKTDPSAVAGENEPQPREVRRCEPVMSVVDDEFRVDPAPVADVVPLDRIQRCACA